MIINFACNCVAKETKTFKGKEGKPDTSITTCLFLLEREKDEKGNMPTFFENVTGLTARLLTADADYIKNDVQRVFVTAETYASTQVDSKYADVKFMVRKVKIGDKVIDLSKSDE